MTRVTSRLTYREVLTEMTPELARAVDQAGPDAVAAVTAYLREPRGDGWLTAVRRALADLLDDPARAGHDGPDPVLARLLAGWLFQPARDLSALAYWLRQQTHPDTVADTPVARLWQALAGEVDAAVGAAMLLDVSPGDV
ncbi:hypothetical protein GCM10010169_25430 [Micromonospora fulviviridis]|uniref:hypothetical protein n=1 Tax=Micromonospora fulviviridis TaxID=47860 RepID=UPI00166A6BD9|nr:hypothetical protein [Micromonospora fulviviridis]GGR80174.1 hypothetical protein GCM10010169_25430 [Micromonospora fulviviridis]